MYSTEGVVLKKIDSGEADALITLYTKEFGKMRAIAQGIKKPGAKLKGHLEMLNCVRVGFVFGRNGERLTQAILLDYWPNMKSDFIRLSLASYVSALFDRHCMPGEKDPLLWDLLMRSFTFIEGNIFSREEGKKFLILFDRQLLAVLGYEGEGDIRILGTPLEKPVY